MMLALAHHSDRTRTWRCSLSRGTLLRKPKSSRRKIDDVQQLIPADARLSSEAMKRWSRAVTQQLLNFAPPTTRTMREAVERFRLEEMHSVRESTRTLYETALIAIEREIGRRGVDGEFRGVALRWRDALPPSIAQMRCYLLGRLLRLCLRWRWRSMPHDLDGLCQIRTKTRTRILTLPQRVELLRELSQPATARRRVAMDCVHWILLTGWRAGEAASLRREYVEEDDGCWVARLPHTKTGPSTRVLGADAVRLLERLPRSGWCFPHRNGKTHVHIRTVHAMFREIALAKGWTDVCLHSMRHGWISVASQLHLSPAFIAAAVGHSGRYQLMRYSHPAPDDVQAVVDRTTEALVKGRKSR